jgi:hypothetical protein
MGEKPSKTTAEEVSTKHACEPSAEVRFGFGPSGQYFFALSEGMKYEYDAYVMRRISAYYN